MSNPLLEFSTLPAFDRVHPNHVAPAIDALLERANTALETVTAPDFPALWPDMARVLDVATEQLGRAWGIVSHLNSVADTPELRAAYNEALPRVTEFWTRLGADERLYAKYKAMDPNALNSEQHQALKNAVRNFVLSGAELGGEDKERFAQIQERQAELAQKFSENALDATDGYAYYAQADALDGVPADVQQTALEAARAEGKQGYKLTLKMPCYLPVMQVRPRMLLIVAAGQGRSAQLGPDLPHLLPRLLQIPGVVHDPRGDRPALLIAGLRAQPRLGVLPLHAAGGDQPLQADLRGGLHHDHAVEAPGLPGFGQQWDVLHHDDAALASGSEGRLPLGLRLPPHRGVDDAVETLAGGVVPEDLPGQSGPVKLAVIGEDLGAEGLDHLREHRGARAHQVPGDLVRVDQVRAELDEHGGDRGFARADAAGQPEVTPRRALP